MSTCNKTGNNQRVREYVLDGESKSTVFSKQWYALTLILAYARLELELSHERKREKRPSNIVVKYLIFHHDKRQPCSMRKEK